MNKKFSKNIHTLKDVQIISSLLLNKFNIIINENDNEFILDLRDKFETIYSKTELLNNIISYYINYYKMRDHFKKLSELYILINNSNSNISVYLEFSEFLFGQLIHDDIIDNDDKRFGVKSIWSAYGIPQAINAGDFMIQKSIDIILNCNLSLEDKIYIISLINNELSNTFEGIALEINLKNNRNPTIRDYFICMEKISSYNKILFVLPIILEKNHNLYIDISKFSYFYGIIDHIYDDLKNLSLSSYKRFSDIEEGKRSLIVCHCSENCTDEERKRMMDIIDKDNVSQYDINFVINLFEKYKSVEFSNNYIKMYAEKALDSIEILPLRLSMKKIIDNFIKNII